MHERRALQVRAKAAGARAGLAAHRNLSFPGCGRPALRPLQGRHPPWLKTRKHAAWHLWGPQVVRFWVGRARRARQATDHVWYARLLPARDDQEEGIRFQSKCFEVFSFIYYFLELYSLDIWNLNYVELIIFTGGIANSQLFNCIFIKTEHSTLINLNSSLNLKIKVDHLYLKLKLIISL